MNITMAFILVTSLALFLTAVFSSVSLTTLFNAEALMIVAGGTVVALFIGFSASRIRKTISNVRDSFHPLVDREELAKEMLDLARASRKADIHSLEKKIHTIKDDFIRLGMSLLISHRTSHEIRSVMDREMEIKLMDFQLSQNVLRAIARLTPSFGLAGTVISLIKIFNSSQSIDDITPLMAVAMMATFYGVIISNLFMLPLCAKLEEHALQTEAHMRRIIEGIVAMNELENPLYIEERISGKYCCDEIFERDRESLVLSTPSAKLRQGVNIA